jgi:O-antigen/teichoic acid export membrane protein
MATAATVTREHIGSAALVMGAKLFGGVSIVLLNIWVARHLPPASFGVFALATTGLLMLDGMVGAALDAAVIGSVAETPGLRPTGAERVAVLLKIGAGAAACVGVPGVMFLVAGRAAATVAALACLGGTGLLLHRSVLVYFQLRERFAWYGAADLAHTAARWGCVALVLNAGYASPSATLGAYAAASWCIASFALLVVPFWTKRAASISASEFQAVTRRVWTALATTGVGALVARLDLLLLGVVATSRETGILAAAATVALAPTWLGAYLAPVFTGRILPYCRERRLQRFFRDVQLGLLVLAVIGAAVGVVAAPVAIGHLLPPSYAPAAGVVPVLLTAGAAGFFTFPLVLHTLLFLSPRTYLVMDLVSLPVLIPLYLVAGREAGALGVAWVTAGSAVLKACIAHAAANAAIHREEARGSVMSAFSGAGV